MTQYNIKNSQGESAPNMQNVNVKKPYNWMVWAIISAVIGLLFCTIGAVPGIIGIVYSSKAQNKFRMGDYIGAQKNNDVAKILTIIGLTISAIVILSLIAFIIGDIQLHKSYGYDY